jgi:manganese-dependent inorganic pyrophosphatase
MKENVYIFGHKNPDTDSVCSAIAYANLKNAIDPTYQYIPIIIGDINKETEFVLKQVDLQKPMYYKHLKPQILDMIFEAPKVVTESASIMETLDKITNDYGRVLPVIGSHNHLIGVVSILPLYMSGWFIEIET